MNDFVPFKRSRNAEEFPISSHVLQIKTDDIRPNRSQPRAEFDQNGLIRLADSIRRYGIIQPLTVRRAESDDIYRYELIAGERRLRAARSLGYLTVPCIIVEADEKLSAEMAIIENLLREDLNMFEQAYGFKKLIENHNMTQDEVAKRMSLSQSAVANKIRLLKLSYGEQQMILEYGLSERHARALLRISDSDLRTEAIRHIASSSMNVINTERYVESILNRTQSEVIEEQDYNIDRYTSRLVSSLRKKVDLLQKQGQDASIRVTNAGKYVDVRIRIERQ